MLYLKILSHPDFAILSTVLKKSSQSKNVWSVHPIRLLTASPDTMERLKMILFLFQHFHLDEQQCSADTIIVCVTEERAPEEQQSLQ